MKPFAALAVALVAAGAHAQLSLDTPSREKAYVVYAAEPQTVPAKKPSTLELRFSIASGYHINSHKPSSEFLIPTALTIQPAAGVRTGEPKYPPGQSYSFSFDPGTRLDVYSGDFTVRLPVVVAAGDHSLEGTLKYQACDNAACYPPRTVPVKVLFNAK